MVAIAESPCYGKQNQGIMVVPSEKHNERPGGTWLSLLGEIAGEKKVGKLNDLGELYKLSLLGEISGGEKSGLILG